ncbi:3-deoxy-D-manno-octulosonic acid transferase [Planctomycetales bacterium 10988]|nr:3-deoxy-D-manno-octulosonic acid transferase [Planctomycetales bacterium 10988]
MSYLLNLIYVAILLLASPWLLWQAIRKGKYRQGWSQKLWGKVNLPPAKGPRIWLHAVSVGEVQLLKPLVARLHLQRSGWECVISTTTQTGYEVACGAFGEDRVFYCPLDFSWAVRRAMRSIQPKALILAELELWPNLMRTAKADGANVFIINGRLSEKSFRGYQKLGTLATWLLAPIDLILAQNEAYAERFLQLGADANSVQVTGSIKYDGVSGDRNQHNIKELRYMTGWPEDAKIVVAGSTQSPEEAYSLAAWKELKANFPELRLILVPRHPERFNEVAELLQQSGVHWQRRSELSPERNNPDVLLVDRMGELQAWWAMATVAFVGGSLDGKRGGQNMIEPSAFGAAVCFGPFTRNFRQVVEGLLAVNGATVVHNQKELTAFIQRCLEHPEEAKQQGERAKQLVQANQGATERTVSQLIQLLESPAGSIRPDKQALSRRAA